MALPKNIPYVPFEETSFGYGSTELATNYATEFPNGDDIVKIIIEHSSGNWDTTGHLSTPSSGTAVAVYNAAKEQLVIKGERDDVDAVLAELSFFPADKEETRTWTPTEWKVNQTTGNYSDEEPPAIGDTVFTVKAYNASDILQVVGDVTFEVTEAVFGNQRPYWTANPSTEDLSSNTHDAVAGGLVDLGTISHGTDTENVQVKCEFRHYGTETQYEGGKYGKFTLDDKIYIGDKKPATRNFTDSRFNFTGSVAEAQAFLDNVRYYNAGNEKTFDMFLTITDGVVGSTLTKTCYFSDALITVNTLPDQSFIEDGDAWIDFGIVTFGNIQEDVTQFSATITFDATGDSGISHGYFGTGTYVDGQPLTTTRSTLAELQADLRLVELYMEQDFNTSYFLTVDFTFSNPTLGTSYTATQQTVNVFGTPTEEISNPTTTHTWTEDQRYDFPNSKIPQIIHPVNERFDVIFTLSDANAGSLSNHSNAAFFTDNFGTSAQYKIEGTRNEVNESLQNLFFTPSADYDDNFTIGITVDRTTGDLTHATQATGSFTMNAVALSDFSFPLVNPEINWTNNENINFDSGLRITDTADELENSPQFGTLYTVVARLKIDGSAFTHGVLTTYFSTLVTVTNNLTNELTLTGTKDNINLALQHLRFIPDPLYEELHDFYVEYRVTRDFDGGVVDGLDYSPNVRTDFKNPTITAPYFSDAQLFDWVEDTPLEFDTLFRITETVSENTYYTPANGYDSWLYSWYKVTIRGKYWDGSAAQELPQINFTTTTAPNYNLLVSGSGTVSDPLVLQGSKAEINKAFATMKMTPATLDFTDAPAGNGGFWFEHKLERMRDSSTITNYNVQLGIFNAGEGSDEYLETWTNVEYIEDIQAQYIFAHLENFIVDRAGDLFDTTYDVSIRLANETTGKFEAYVDEGYLEDDDLNIFVNDYEVRIVGSKAEVNEAIQGIQFTPYADVNANVDIHYTQKRTYNNSTVTHADDAVVTTMVGNATPEFVYGSTVYANLQFFTQEEFINGVDTTKTKEEILSGQANTVLTPRRIMENIKREYDAPITVLDTFEDGGPSLYKIVFSGGSLFVPLGASLNITDTGWQTKAELNKILEDGIYVTEVSYDNDNIPSHYNRFTANFSLHRRSAQSVETVIANGTLEYMFLSALRIQSVIPSSRDSITNELTDFVYTDIDKYSANYETLVYNHPGLVEVGQNGEFEPVIELGNPTRTITAEEDIVLYVNRSLSVEASEQGDVSSIRFFGHELNVNYTHNEFRLVVLQGNGTTRPNINLHSEFVDIDTNTNYVETYEDNVRYIVNYQDEAITGQPKGNFRITRNVNYNDISVFGDFGNWFDFDIEHPFTRKQFGRLEHQTTATFWTDYGVILQLGSSNTTPSLLDKRLIIAERQPNFIIS